MDAIYTVCKGIYGMHKIFNVYGHEVVNNFNHVHYI